MVPSCLGTGRSIGEKRECRNDLVTDDRRVIEHHFWRPRWQEPHHLHPNERKEIVSGNQREEEGDEEPYVLSNKSTESVGREGLGGDTSDWINICNINLRSEREQER